MSTTSSDERQFAEKLFGSEKLDEAIQWIAENLSPTDVFSEDKLIKWTSVHKKPEDVYRSKVLKEWALENGYISNNTN